MDLEPLVDVSRTRSFWIARKPGETAAPAYVPDPPHFWHVAGWLAVALILQSTLASTLAVRGATVSFVLLLVVWYGVRSGSLLGLTFGLIAGACEDALAGSTGVAWTFSTALAGFSAGRVARTWLADLPLVLALGAALLTLVRYAAFVIIMQMEGREVGLPVLHLHAVLWQALQGGCVAFLALRLRPSLVGSDAYGR